jgi:hypothetical protein
MSYFRLWVGMQSRFSVILSGSVLLIGMQVATASAEDKLQAFQNSSGKVVFTNLVENAPAPLQASKGGESSAPECPQPWVRWSTRFLQTMGSIRRW